MEKSQLCPIAPKFFLVGSWVMKDPTGNRISSKWPYLLPFKSYGQKTIVFTRFWRFRLKMIVFGHNSETVRDRAFLSSSDYPWGLL